MDKRKEICEAKGLTKALGFVTLGAIYEAMTEYANYLNWTPFPTNIPEEDGFYMTTLHYGNELIVIENQWSAHFKKWSNSHYIVTAFCTNPEPYIEITKEKT